MRLIINPPPPELHPRYAPFIAAARAAGVTMSDGELCMLMDAPNEIGWDVEEFDAQPSYVIGQA
jgi:hypothetical protein